MNQARVYIDQLFQALRQNDSVKLEKLFNMRCSLYKSVYFNDESKKYINSLFENSSNDVYTWFEVVENHILARNSLFEQDFVNSFDWHTKSFKCLIDLLKDAKDENWQLPILFSTSVDLRLLAYACDSKKLSPNDSIKSKSQQTNSDNIEPKPDEYAEKAAECLMQCFRNLCTDTRTEAQVSKRWGMMHLVNQLFKIYFKINKINLCNPLKRVVENSGLKDSFPQSHQITYKFYVGRQAMFDNDFNTAATYFEYAFKNCPNVCLKNKKIILFYLIPVNMLRGFMPKQALLRKYDLKEFAEIVTAVKQGNIRKFDSDMRDYEDFFIQSGVYLFLEKLKMTTYRNLFKKISYLLKTVQLPIDVFVEILKHLGDDEIDNDECQCILSNLIYEGKIKGYISFKFNKLVISKDFRNAFPKLSTISA
jgi:hypothetical protein